MFPRQTVVICIELIAYPDFDAIAVDQPTVESGSSTPGLRQILLERRLAEYLGCGIGAVFPIQTEAGDRYALTVVGIVHDMSQVPPSLFGQTVVTSTWIRCYGRGNQPVTIG